jgi:CRP-like cAMP-binding protein
METIDRILAEHPFSRDLLPEHIGIIAGCATNEHFEAGRMIFREGEEANRFFLIRHGKVALEIHTERGPITIQTLGPGEVLGWSWLVPPYQWRFDARALELTRATALDGACLRTKCDNDPKMGYELLKRFALVLEERLQATRLQLLDVYGIHR